MSFDSKKYGEGTRYKLEPAPTSTCPLCKGTGQRDVVSFVDSGKTVKNSCSVCKGKGVLPSDREPATEAVPYVDRGDAVNLAHNWLDSQGPNNSYHLTPKGIKSLCEAVINMDAALKGKGASQGVEGMVMVPRELTEAMWNAWRDCGNGPEECYRAMLTAAEASPKGKT